MSTATATTFSGARVVEIDRTPTSQDAPANTTVEMIEQSMRQHPAIWIGAAVAAGMVVGWLVKRR